MDRRASLIVALTLASFVAGRSARAATEGSVLGPPATAPTAAAADARTTAPTPPKLGRPGVVGGDARPDAATGASAAYPALTASRPAIASRRVTEAPVLDGRLDDPAWRAAPAVSDFVQQSPVFGNPPSESTQLRVIYDDEALYLGVECTQLHTPIVGRLTRRDQDSESDWIWLNIDSRRDGRTAAFFAVNVAGVIADGIFRDTPTGAATTMEWDENWEARTARTPTGWSAEFRIPLRILRFRRDLPVQSWGFAAFRFTGASQETDSWPAIPREAASPFLYFGRIEDLRGLKSGEELELRPFGLARVRRLGPDPMVDASGFDHGLSAGLDLKLHLTPSMTFDGAVNPDFAQVEVDQIIFNLGRYEILLPEKRPLFLEGADQLATPLALFYSRRIGSSPATPTLQPGANGAAGERFVNVPDAATLYGAAKVFGRIDDTWTVGALSVLAARNDYQVVPVGGGPTVARTAEPLTMFNVLRLRRDVGRFAQIGVIGTATDRFEQTGPGERTCPTGGTAQDAERCFRDAYTAGMDGVWRPNGGNVVASAQLVGGVVEHGKPQTQLDGTTIRSGDGGFGAWARVARDGGQTVLGDVTYTGLERKLTFNDLGFMLRQNLHEVKAGLELRTLQPGVRTLERHVRLDVTTRRNFDGLDLGTLFELGAWTRLRNFWSLRLSALGESAYFDDLEIGSGAALERAAFVGGRLELSSDPRRKVAGALRSEVHLLASGESVDTQVTVTLQPMPQIEVALTPQVVYSNGERRYVWHTSTPDLFGKLRASNLGATLRASYTFTPRLSLQAYGQIFLGAWHYTDFTQASTASGARIRLADLPFGPAPANAPSDADYEQAALNMQVVLRWEYRLGSTLFLVYSRSQTPAVNLQAGEPAGLRAADIGRVPAVDMVLLKLSFWWAA